MSGASEAMGALAGGAPVPDDGGDKFFPPIRQAGVRRCLDDDLELRAAAALPRRIRCIRRSRLGRPREGDRPSRPVLPTDLAA